MRNRRYGKSVDAAVSKARGIVSRGLSIERSKPGRPPALAATRYFTRDVLNRFPDLEHGSCAIGVRDSPVLDISRTTLPASPTVIALPGGY